MRLCWPYWLTPWRSPLLRWRMETYGMRDAASGRILGSSEITATGFLHFISHNRTELIAFLRWASRL